MFLMMSSGMQAFFCNSSSANGEKPDFVEKAYEIAVLPYESDSSKLSFGHSNKHSVSLRSFLATRYVSNGVQWPVAGIVFFRFGFAPLSSCDQ